MINPVEKRFVAKKCEADGIWSVCAGHSTLFDALSEHNAKMAAEYLNEMEEETKQPEEQVCPHCKTKWIVNRKCPLCALLKIESTMRFNREEHRRLITMNSHKEESYKRMIDMVERES